MFGAGIDENTSLVTKGGSINQDMAELGGDVNQKGEVNAAGNIKNELGVRVPPAWPKGYATLPYTESCVRACVRACVLV